MITEEKIKAVINKIRHALQIDGGDIEFISYENGIVKVRLKGSCAGCPMSHLTLKTLVEGAIKTEVPEVSKVEAI